MEAVVLQGLKTIALISVFVIQPEFQMLLLEVPFLRRGLRLPVMRCWVCWGLNLACREIIVFLEWCSFYNPFFNRLLANDMFFNDSFDAVGRNISVPNPIWPDQKNRPSFAHPEAICFAAQNNPLQAFRVFEIQFTNNALEFIPGLCPKRRIAAFGFAGGCAEQEVMADSLHA
ncbi:hypothetical protein [Parasynechococcus sp.]|uniref:hypothetical protein n=1 Tax=Parasynechococcus sp. TaxID=3101203 RepID=UPI003704C9CC